MPALVMSHVVLFIFIDRSSKPRMLGRQSSKDYGMFEGEGDNLMSSEDQLRELENIRSVCPPSLPRSLTQPLFITFIYHAFHFGYFAIFLY